MNLADFLKGCKRWTMVFIMVFSSLYVFAQDCKTSFEFLNCTNARTACHGGANYRMELKNLSSKAQVYTLTVKDLTPEGNALKEFSLRDFYLKPILSLSEEGKTYVLKVEAQQTLIFYVNVKIGEDEKTTNESQIILKAQQCADFMVEKTLRTNFSPLK